MAPIISVKCYEIDKTGGIRDTQRSAPLDYSVEFETLGWLRMEYVVPPEHCSDIRLHILIDGKEVYESGFLGPVGDRPQEDPVCQVWAQNIVLEVPRGVHKLTLSPEGRIGGCNEGTLISWAGTLLVWTRPIPKKK